MNAPFIEIHLEKLKKNAAKLKQQCDKNGIEIAFVTKGFCADIQVIKAVEQMGIKLFADSRMKNIERVKTELGQGANDIKYLLIRIPMISEVESVVKYADMSVQSQLEVIKAISEEALKQNKIHKIILMIDVGDLREGVLPEEAIKAAEEIKNLKGVELIGVGTNVGCYGSIKPSVENTMILVHIKEKINNQLELSLNTISGGSTCTLALMEQGKLHKDINQLRIGEAILFGEDSTNGRFLEGFENDCFVLNAEVVELKDKPSMPIGDMGFDAFGQAPVYIDKGFMKRAILAIGKQDVRVDALTPLTEGIEILGASSDHMILDVTNSTEEIYVGKRISFRCAYTAVLSAMTSQYVEVVYK